MRAAARAQLHRNWEIFADIFPATPWFVGQYALGVGLSCCRRYPKWSGTRALPRNHRPVFFQRCWPLGGHPDVAPVFERQWASCHHVICRMRPIEHKGAPDMQMALALFSSAQPINKMLLQWRAGWRRRRAGRSGQSCATGVALAPPREHSRDCSASWRRRVPAPPGGTLSESRKNDTSGPLDGARCGRLAIGRAPLKRWCAGLSGQASGASLVSNSRRRASKGCGSCPR